METECGGIGVFVRMRPLARFVAPQLFDAAPLLLLLYSVPVDLPLLRIVRLRCCWRVLLCGGALTWTPLIAGTVNHYTAPLGVSENRRTEMKICEAGYYCPGDGRRVNCPAGSYCTAGVSAPTHCPEVSGGRGSSAGGMRRCSAGGTDGCERACVQGRYGSSENLPTSACSGPCLRT